VRNNSGISPLEKPFHPGGAFIISFLIVVFPKKNSARASKHDFELLTF
jgi:hypothetical protein